MTDSLSRQKRSALMSKVRSADTKPEWVLRCALHRLGFRYRLRNRHLPGRPDLAFAKHKAVVFVHGCFWHRHSNCRRATAPKSNVAFWTAKFEKNKERDRRSKRQLAKQGWRVLVVWECELIDHTMETISRVACWLRRGTASSRVSYRDKLPFDRSEVLSLAEERVRYRIASYGDR